MSLVSCLKFGDNSNLLVRSDDPCEDRPFCVLGESLRVVT